MCIWQQHSLLVLIYYLEDLFRPVIISVIHLCGPTYSGSSALVVFLAGILMTHKKAGQTVSLLRPVGTGLTSCT